jgi:hypothetical protein
MDQLDHWQIISVVFAFGGVICGIGKMLLDKTEKNIMGMFTAQEVLRETSRAEWNTRFNALEVMATRADGDLMTMKITLPTIYVQREDWIRLSAIIEKKMDVIDTLKAQVELILLITRQNGGKKNE